MIMLIVVLVLYIFIGILVVQKVANEDQDEIKGGEVCFGVAFWPIVLGLMLKEGVYDNWFTWATIKPRATA